MTSSQKNRLLEYSLEEAFYFLRDYRGVYETPTLETISNVKYNDSMGSVEYDYTDTQEITRHFLSTEDFTEMTELKNPY